MENKLITLRVLGVAIGSLSLVWAFIKYRNYKIRKREFFLILIIGLGLITVSVSPNSINVLAGMLAMEDQQFGRLITLLILSNMLLWALVIGLRIVSDKKSLSFDLLVRKLSFNQYLQENGLEKIKEITVIIPALNEAKNLKELLPRMPEYVHGIPLGVLVVDDGSQDDTVLVVKNLGYSVVSNVINRGGGAALRLGYDIALAGGAKIIITMDGDCQHQPEDIPQLVEPILRNESDFVIGSRVLGTREKDSLVRWFGIHIFSAIINFLAGTSIKDCSNGFRAFRSDKLKNILLIQDQYHTAELIVDAARKGIQICETPVTVTRRYSGQSKKGKNLIYGYSFLKTVMKTWLRY